MLRAFFPLRSNVNWFQGPSQRASLDLRLKEALLIYDEVLIEDGTFIAEYTEEGGHEWHWPPGSLPPEERRISFERDIAKSEMRLGIKRADSEGPYEQFLGGETVARFKIDFADLTAESAIRDVDFVHHVMIRDAQLVPRVRRAIDQAVFRDRSQLDPETESIWVRNLVIKSLNRDLIVSGLLPSATVVDAVHLVAFRQKCRLPEEAVPEGSEHQVALQQLLTATGPDLTALSIDDVLELRGDSAWVEFRAFLGEVVCLVCADPAILTNAHELQSAMSNAISRELFKELKARHRGGVSLAIDLGLGVLGNIPGLGLLASLADGGKDVAEWWKDRGTWMAFVQRIEEKGRANTS